jgi:hypothetical protein
LQQRANEVFLPTYDALNDPFLVGFFQNPLVKKNLKETGVLKKKRRYSVKLRKSPMRREADFLLTEG